jgi:hypothetical protein
MNIHDKDKKNKKDICKFNFNVSSHKENSDHESKEMTNALSVMDSESNSNRICAFNHGKKHDKNEGHEKHEEHKDHGKKHEEKESKHAHKGKEHEKLNDHHDHKDKKKNKKHK